MAESGLNKWACPTCTFLNDAQAPICTICAVGHRPRNVGTTPGGPGGQGAGLSELLEGLRGLESQLRGAGGPGGLPGLAGLPDLSELSGLTGLPDLSGMDGLASALGMTTGGDLSVQSNYRDNPSHIFAHWKVTKAQWIEIFTKGYDTNLFSDRFFVPCEDEMFTFQIHLSPAGCKPEQQAMSKYGLYLVLADKPRNVESISISLNLTLAELPSHSFDARCPVERVCGVGPNLGFAPSGDVLDLNVDVLTYTVDLCILSVLKKDSLEETSVRTQRHYEGDPHRVLAEWHVPKSLWHTWKRHFGYQQHVESKGRFRVPFGDKEIEFYFCLDPNGRNAIQKGKEFYGFGIFPVIPPYVQTIHLNVASGLKGCPSHTHRWPVSISQGGTSSRLGSGPISDVDRIREDEVVFTFDVQITGLQLKYEPMPQKCVNLLKSWNLDRFVKPMEGAGMIDDEVWHEASETLLMQMGMKPGEVMRFRSHTRNLAKERESEEKEERRAQPVPEPPIRQNYNRGEQPQYDKDSQSLRLEIARLTQELATKEFQHQSEIAEFQRKNIDLQSKIQEKDREIERLKRQPVSVNPAPVIDEKEQEDFSSWFHREYQSSRTWKSVFEKCMESGFDDNRFLLEMSEKTPNAFRQNLCSRYLGIVKDVHFKRFVRGIQKIERPLMPWLIEEVRLDQLTSEKLSECLENEGISDVYLLKEWMECMGEAESQINALNEIIESGADLNDDNDVQSDPFVVKDGHVMRIIWAINRERSQQDDVVIPPAVNVPTNGPGWG